MEAIQVSIDRWMNKQNVVLVCTYIYIHIYRQTYTYRRTVNPWTAQGLWVLTLCTVKNMHITLHLPSISVVHDPRNNQPQIMYHSTCLVKKIHVKVGLHSSKSFSRIHCVCIYVCVHVYICIYTYNSIYLSL